MHLQRRRPPAGGFWLRRQRMRLVRDRIEGRASPGASAASTRVVAPLSDLVGATRPSIGWFPWHLCVRKIWIGNAHGGEARCIGVALRHRAIAAVESLASAPV